MWNKFNDKKPREYEDKKVEYGDETKLKLYGIIRWINKINGLIFQEHLTIIAQKYIKVST